MLRVFKVSSPMSVGSWLLAGFVPAASVAALSDVTKRLRLLGAAGTWSAAAAGPLVATYTATLISDTAVPAWHDAHRWMPFVFGSSALSSAAAVGLILAPTEEVGPLVPLATAGGLAEVALTKVMEKRSGLAGEAYHESKPKRYLRASEVLATAGAVIAALGTRSRACAVVGGSALLVAGIAERFGIFEAGIASADDPKYTVVPQRERLQNKERR
jgi:MFS family permease